MYVSFVKCRAKKKLNPYIGAIVKNNRPIFQQKHWPQAPS